MKKLRVRNLTKSFSNNENSAVNNISFDLYDGEVLALIGPSGCGKTTTLRLIAGLETPDSGEIHIDNQLVSGRNVFVQPEARGVGMVFQEHALFPHLTVYQNVAFGLHSHKNGRVKDSVMEYLALVEMEKMADRYPHEISGGERQRVALARALAPQPVLLLMDEPFNSLDADLRLQVRQQVRSVLQAVNASVIFVTHDQEEALFIGDRLAVINGGKVEQIGKPEEVFHTSKTRFVAEFMGDSDFLRGTTSAQGIHTSIGIIPQWVDLPDNTVVEIGVRADDIDFNPHPSGNGTITERIFSGPFYIYRVKLDSGQTLNAFKLHTEVYSIDTRVNVTISADHPLPVFRNGESIAQIRT